MCAPLPLQAPGAPNSSPSALVRWSCSLRMKGCGCGVAGMELGWPLLPPPAPPPALTLLPLAHPCPAPVAAPRMRLLLPTPGARRLPGGALPIAGGGALPIALPVAQVSCVAGAWWWAQVVGAAPCTIRLNAALLPPPSPQQPKPLPVALAVALPVA